MLMNSKLQNSFNGVYIFDDFLSEDVFDVVSQTASQTRLFIPDEEDPEAIWSTNRGRNPCVSQSILKPLADFDRRILIAGGFGNNTFPTNTMLDLALTLIENRLSMQRSFGVPQKDWAGLIASIFSYTENTNLPWHKDNLDYTGAFVLYLHKTWIENSGGELLIDSANCLGGTNVISPIPNRLVLIDEGVRHAVNIIRGSITPRTTLSGFAIRTERVPYLLHRFAAWPDASGGLLH